MKSAVYFLGFGRVARSDYKSRSHRNKNTTEENPEPFSFSGCHFRNCLFPPETEMFIFLAGGFIRCLSKSSRLYLFWPPFSSILETFLHSSLCAHPLSCPVFWSHPHLSGSPVHELRGFPNPFTLPLLLPFPFLT